MINHWLWYLALNFFFLIPLEIWQVQVIPGPMSTVALVVVIICTLFGIWKWWKTWRESLSE